VDPLIRNNVRVVGPGDGPPMVLAHGFGCDQSIWRLISPTLSRRYRLVLFDHVGSGGSDVSAWDPQRHATLDGYAADILEVVDALALRGAVYVGHSVAAMMGVLAAIARPDAFAKMVLLTPSPRYLDDGEYRGGFTRADIDDLLKSLDENYLGWAQTFAPIVMGNRDRPELTAEISETFCRADPDCAKVFARATFLGDHRGELPKVPIPTLMIDCTDDVIAPPSVGTYVAEHIPDCRRLTLATDGHCPHVSAPAATAAAISSFVDGMSR
jgi:sigma-B regulation protein RsbQ